MALVALLGALGFLFCVFDWRRGLLLCLAVGFLQDPLRKVTPGQPVAFVVLVGVFFAGCGLGYMRQHGLGGLRAFFAWYPALRAPVTVFVAVVSAQSLVTVLRTGSFVLAGIGMLSYLSPLAALFLGQRFCVSGPAIGRWQKVYLAGALTVGVSIFLAFVGVSSRVFESIGLETVFGRGGRIQMISGVMRSSEIAAWHVATAACLVVIWSAARRQTRAFWLGTATAIALVLAMVLTGRRKTLAEVGLFLALYAWLIARARLGATRFARLGLVFVVALFAVVAYLLGSGGDTRWNPYLERSFSVVADAGDRLQAMVGPQQLMYVIDRNGILGQGAGSGAQGSQYFGGGERLVGGGAEGGLARILAELGLPGVLAAAWLTAAVAGRLFHIARWLPRLAPRHGQRFFGFVALLPANAVVFLTAHQVFGDPFVLIVIGFVASSALAFPQIVYSEEQSKTGEVVAPSRGFQGRLARA